MEIIWKKRVTTEENGTFDLQIEDWSKDYPGTFPYGNTLVAYPTSKIDADGIFSPKCGREFRCAFNFPNRATAGDAAEAIAFAGAELSWYAEYMERPEYLGCLTGNC